MRRLNYFHDIYYPVGFDKFNALIKCCNIYNLYHDHTRCSSTGIVDSGLLHDVPSKSSNALQFTVSMI